MVVKRDPSDEPPPLQYRPPSTGTAQELPPAAQHHHDGGGRYLPPFEPRPPYPTSFPPPQSPLSATEQYHPQFPGPPRETYSTVTYPTNPQGGKPPKKATRAAQACDSCRNLKAKCDEGRPSCSSCKEKNIECRYRDPPPKQQDKTSSDILEAVHRLEQVNALSHSDILSRLDKLERQIAANSSEREFKQETVGETKTQIPNQEYSVQQSTGGDSRAIPTTESPYPATPLQPQLPDRSEIVPYGQGQGQGQKKEGEEEDEDEGRDPGPSKPPSIPINHTTGAARLLLNLAIEKLCGDYIRKSKIKNEKYPIIQEEKRGLLRLYGRGEGTDAPPGYDKDPLIDHGAESNSGDTNSDVSSPAGEEWGQVGGMTPPGNPPPERIGGVNKIDSDGMPDFKRETVLKLVQSYKDNFNNMHPLLIPNRLDLLIDSFLKSMPESQGRPKQVASLVANNSVAGFVGRYPESPGNKRKRSPGLSDYPTEVHRDWDLKSGHPFRSISSALVLCVLALGSIGLWKSAIPECAPDRDEPAYSASPTVRNGLPPSPLHSSPSLSTPMGVTSPPDTDMGHPQSRRTSIEAPYTRGPSRMRNIDVIPGLPYFAMATDIIGNQLGGNSLQHVHCNVLAGLYQGQLGRVLESHSFINQACRSLQVILRPKLDRFKRLRDTNGYITAKDNPLVIAFWTCLQLESDIVAEIPIPQSGILTFEEDMPAPNLHAASAEDGFDPLVMESYGAQLFLRKHLNQLHNMFYRPEEHYPENGPPPSTKVPHFPTIQACEANLKNFPGFAPNMTWNENDPPATDILRARLRGKYYGAQVITYRPFLLYVISQNAKEDPAKKDPELGDGNNYKDGIRDVPLLHPEIKEIDEKIIMYADNCIRALINSTTAFHEVAPPGEKRLIVTNIWGTAHAQWGNVLCLQAAHKDPMLSKYINKEQLQSLLDKTLAFLRFHAAPTSALSTDVKILEWTGHKLELYAERPQGPNTTSSFSSATT